MSTLAVARACKAITKAGNPCRGRPVPGDDRCWVHSPSIGLDVRSTGRNGGIRSGEVRRELALSPRMRLSEALDERAERIAENLAEAAEALSQRARDGDANLAVAAVRVVEVLLDQTGGRPGVRTSLEITGPHDESAGERALEKIMALVRAAESEADTATEETS